MADFYLTIVAGTRNDNHGGDLLRRCILFVEGIYHQAAKFDFPLELLIVEWNPPAGKPPLRDVLPKPPTGCPVCLRYVVVPPDSHARFNKSKLPFHQMIAKNVGIRRARGRFVLSTNIDILFSDNCFKKIVDKKLKENHFYRNIRADVPKKIMDLEGFEPQQRFAEKNVMQRLGFSVDCNYPAVYPTYYHKYPFLLKILDGTLHLVLTTLGGKRNPVLALNAYACGDFTLMAKADWVRIKGYYELEMFPLHVDYMALIAAAAIGMKQVSFPYDACVYHIYHDNGWSSEYGEPEDLIQLMYRRPSLDYGGVIQAGGQLLEKGRNFNLNDDSWGLADENLVEFIFSAKEKMLEKPS